MNSAATYEVIQRDRPGRLQKHRTPVRRLVRHCRDETIAVSRHRFDVRGRASLVAERLSQRQHVDRQNAFLDEDFRPDACEQFVLRDQTSGLPGEQGQNVVRFRGEMNDGTALRKPALGDIERELAEMEDLTGGHECFRKS